MSTNEQNQQQSTGTVVQCAYGNGTGRDHGTKCSVCNGVGSVLL